MQRVLNLAYTALSDQQNALAIIRAGAGFDVATSGLYFNIRHKKTNRHLCTIWGSNEEGAPLIIWGGKADNKENVSFSIHARDTPKF